MNNQRILTVPRGTVNAPAIQLDMTPLDEAERRLIDVRTVTPATQKDLEGLFNEAANTATKYLAWIEYEVLQAQKRLDLDRATVILDKAPEYANSIKESGIKMNETIREALIARDEACQMSLDVLNSLKAVKALLEAKSESFVRAHYSSRAIADYKGQAPTPNFSGPIGRTYDMPQTNFMGENSGSIVTPSQPPASDSVIIGKTKF